MNPVTRQIRELITLLAEDQSDTPVVREGLRLKADHTVRVANTARFLAMEAHCTPREILLAERIGWCHDLGRFLQFRKFQTFDDSRSVDHGLLSLKLVRALQLGRDLFPQERGLLWAAVLLHNRVSLPQHLPPSTRFFCALIRDADRLDIFHLFKAYYDQGPEPGSPLELGYPDTGQLSPGVVETILSGHSPSYEAGHSVQDMRLIKLSWSYALETPGAAGLFLDSGVIDATRRVLPDTAAVREALMVIEMNARQKK